MNDRHESSAATPRATGALTPGAGESFSAAPMSLEHPPVAKSPVAGEPGGAATSPGRTSVWAVCVPDYDNYDFDLYATREAALAAIKTKVGDEIGDWSETFDGTQIEFQRRTPVRGLPTLKQVWSLEEVEIHG